MAIGGHHVFADNFYVAAMVSEKIKVVAPVEAGRPGEDVTLILPIEVGNHIVVGDQAEVRAVGIGGEQPRVFFPGRRPPAVKHQEA